MNITQLFAVPPADHDREDVTFTMHELMHEALARAQMHEDRRRAAQRREAHRLVVARRWNRLARFAARRARRYGVS